MDKSPHQMAKEHLEEIRRKIEEEKYGKGYQRPIPQKAKPEYQEHPNTMENGTATFFYIAVMLISLIFKDRWLIWVVASFIYFNFITRHDTK